MNISIISFTETGAALSEGIADIRSDCMLYTKCKTANGSIPFEEESIGTWACRQMQERNALVFIGACGIAVRAIAPYVKDKLCDSPVLVVDELGRHVIPLLSGHVGGANELAEELAMQIGAIPVITTATDLEHKFAVDMFAKKNGFFIRNREGIAAVSAKVLAGKSITMAIEQERITDFESVPEQIKIVVEPPKMPVDVWITSELPEKAENAALVLQPQEYVIGVGCRRGKEIGQIETFLAKKLQELGIAEWKIWKLASIDRKKDEEALVQWSKKRRIPFETFSAEQLERVPGEFRHSAFVKQQVGVDNVCERAALLACGVDGTLVSRKYAEDGMTVAIAKRTWRVTFHEK